MDRRHLEYFRTVAESGSVSTAAARLHVTQPAVSKQIARAESELGVRLFHRTSGGMVLTAAGHTLLTLGADLLTRFERAETVMRARHRNRPAFRIACPHATADGIMTPFMADTDPPIIDLRIGQADELDRMLDGDIDMAVSSMAPPANRHRVVVAEIPIMIQCTPAASSRFDPAEQGDLERLGEQWAIVPRSGVATAVRAATVSFDPPLLLREASVGRVAQSLAANEHGYALVTEEQRFGLVAVPAFARDAPVTISMYASWDGHHAAAAELARVAEDLQSWMTANPPWGAPLAASN